MANRVEPCVCGRRDCPERSLCEAREPIVAAQERLFDEPARCPGLWGPVVPLALPEQQVEQRAA